MKNEKGITLIALIVYILLSIIVISTIALISANFLSNMDVIANNDEYAVEFNKFNMFFINDVKRNKEATVEPTKITFKDNGVVYELIGTDIYRDGVIIANRIQSAEFSTGTYIVPNMQMIDTKKPVEKKLIKVHLVIGRKSNNDSILGDSDEKAYQRLNKEIEYVLKYW